MTEWLLFPLLVGIFLAVVGGPLGSFVVWQRMAYIGESIAHSALLGVGLAVFFNFSMTFTVLATCCLVGMLLSLVRLQSRLSINTLLAIVAHTSLASGLIIISLVPGFQLDINSFLFGDLLTASKSDFITVLLVSIIILFFLLSNWRSLVSMAVNEELAFVEGINVSKLQLGINLSLAALIAIGIKAVGVLLIVSLLIIPAATCRRWCSRPESMAICASLLAAGYVSFGLSLSYYYDTPAGPSIVAFAGFSYLLSLLIATKTHS